MEGLRAIHQTKGRNVGQVDLDQLRVHLLQQSVRVACALDVTAVLFNGLRTGAAVLKIILTILIFPTILTVQLF